MNHHVFIPLDSAFAPSFVLAPRPRSERRPDARIQFGATCSSFSIRDGRLWNQLEVRASLSVVSSEKQAGLELKDHFWCCGVGLMFPEAVHSAAAKEIDFWQ